MIMDAQSYGCEGFLQLCWLKEFGGGADCDYNNILLKEWKMTKEKKGDSTASHYLYKPSYNSTAMHYK